VSTNEVASLREAAERVAASAAVCHGLVQVGRLSEAGVSRRRLEGLVRNGFVHRVGRGVYAVSGSPDTWERRLTAGLMILGEGSVVSHGAAARVHGFDRWVSDIAEFTVPRRQRSGADVPGVVHTSSSLARTDVVTVSGFPATSATRTIIDLARTDVPVTMLESAIDSAVRTGLTAPHALIRRLGELRGRGRWGCRILDELLVDAGGHTRLERLFLRLVREAGLPRPATQVIHRAHGRHVARVDFMFVEHHLVVEVTGRHGHTSPSERARDAQRRNELQDLGVRVYEFTWADVTQRPEHVAAAVTRYLRAAGWRP
jgi:hypothetical protein